MKQRFAGGFFVQKTHDGADFVGGEKNKDVVIHATSGCDSDDVAFFDAERKESLGENFAIRFKFAASKIKFFLVDDNLVPMAKAG